MPLTLKNFYKQWWYSDSSGYVICTAISWCPWIAVVRYKTDWSMWINCATWWCVYCCNWYTIHCFTSDWTFCIVS